jgi:hypothetical protein
MTLVTIDSSVLDSTTLLALVGIAFVIAFIVLLIYFLYNRFRTPKEALDIKKASNRGQMAMMVVGLDQFADIMPVKDFIPEGIKETEPIGKGAKKISLRFNVPRAERVPGDLEVADGKSREATAKVLESLYKLNTEKTFLRKAKIPFLAAVRNSVAAVSLKFLGVQVFLGKLERIQKGGTLYPQIQALKASKSFSELGLWLEDLATGISVVDFQQVYARAASTVGQTKLDSISERDQTIGRREGKEDKEKATKTVLYLIMGALGMGILLVVAAYLLGGGGGGS